MATTKSYHHYLIESLKDPNEAAAYLWAVLQEENPEPELLKSALEDILEAYAPQLSPEVKQLQSVWLEQLPNYSGSEVIYGLAQWLQNLGLELTVTIREQKASSQVQTDVNLGIAA